MHHDLSAQAADLYRVEMERLAREERMAREARRTEREKEREKRRRR
ncbi:MULTISPECIES: hypothetical protein [Nocardiopsis]|jgi:hypothetical protein|uniref:Uncharacterized protein n=2 Tax=Nocardiopsis alba TaxID=53437 RepID=A0ABV5DU38_9ACTN|nr:MULTISPECIES: hypothetical protein [Nocardiopsis]AFR06205.1 hypothetical protein B005_0957 [Nocardiopsis alba ATCC BAA-2165]MEC3893078.1 hypothetical protein [Nocardiopsis sp. LDBS1602]